MGRAPCCDKDGLKKGPWLPEEDQKLIDHIQKHGPGNWRTLPKKAGLERCGKSCRLRWTNYLRPDIKRGRFTFEEEETIIQLHSILGNKWSAIAAKLPGRTDNEIKNYWNTHIRKRMLRMGIDPVTHTRRLDFLDLRSILNSPSQNHPQLNLLKLLGLQSLVNPDLLSLANLLSSHQNENLNHHLMENLQANQVASTSPMQNPFNQLLQTSSQIQNLVQNTATTPTYSASPSVPNVVDGENMGSNAMQYPQNMSNFNAEDYGAEGSALVNGQWQGDAMLNSVGAADNIFQLSQTDQAIMDRLFDRSGFQSDNSNQSLSLSSVLSTPSSSQQTPLSSNSGYPNSTGTTGTEDEIDSYCENLMNFDIPVDLF